MNSFKDIYPDQKIVGTTRRSSQTQDKIQLELTGISNNEIHELLKKLRPESVVYLAGITNVEDCEKEKGLALDLNANIPAMIAGECKAQAVKFLYISSDHLFGDEGSLFLENEIPVLVNYYAYSKRLAEEMILKNYPEALIVRTNFYGKSLSSKTSFSDWIYNSLVKNVEIKIATDIFFNPVFMGDLVRVCHILLDKNQSGLFNVTSDERISKYDFVVKFAKTFALDSDLVKSFSEELNPRPVRRPLEMSLCNLKMKNITEYPIGDTAKGFERLKKEMSIIF